MDKIARLIVATREVQVNVDRARDILEVFDRRIIDDHGVLSDPTERQADIVAAIEVLTATLHIIRTTDWPPSTDPDAEQKKP